MEEKQKKTYLSVISGVIGFGVGLALVAIFLAMVNASGMGEKASMTLFDDDVELFGLSIGFPLAAFAITIVGGIILVTAVTMRIKQNKKFTPLILAGIAITTVGAILVLVAGIIFKNDTEEAFIAFIVEEMGGSLAEKELYEAAARALVSINLGAGVYLGFIGGLIAAIGGGILLLKPFAPSAPAPAEPVQPVAPEQQPAVQSTQPNANTCANCGASLAPNATFCGKCGTRVQQPNNNDQNPTL